MTFYSCVFLRNSLDISKGLFKKPCFGKLLKLYMPIFFRKQVMSAIARLGHLRRMVTELIMLAELKESLAGRGLELSWTEDVRKLLVKEAYSVTYGARNLRRTIQQKLEDPISEKIIDSFESPISSIAVSVEDEAVVVEAQ